MKSIYSEEYVEIITRLRTLRIKSGVTQQQLASSLNVTQSFISKVENCDIKLDVIEFLNWIKSLKIKLQDVIPNKYL